MSGELKGIIIAFAPFLGFLVNAILLLIETRKSISSKEHTHAKGHHGAGHSEGEFGITKKISAFVSPLAPFASFVATLLILPEKSQINIFNWIPLENVNVSFSVLIDELSKTALLYVTGVSTLIHIYSIGYMKHDEGFVRYFMFLNLFVFFMIQIVVADNLVQLFLGWEGVGLCSYFLIGFWYSGYENARAGFKAFITNRIGDFGFIVGIVLFLVYTGGVDYNKVSLLRPEQFFAVAFFLFMGAAGKSAQGPLWLWLPDAMRGPTPVSALIHAATMVTAGVYMVVRLEDLFFRAKELVFYTGIITAILMGIFGLFERDIKRILAFSTLSQLGLMFAGAATEKTYTGMFHVFEHSFFKAALFLISGILMHEFDNETDIYKLKERKPAEKGMILSAGGFLICTLAMSGVFPLSGFWSKEAIISAVAETFGNTGTYLMLIASFITPVYMFRAFFVTFGGQRWKFSLSPSHDGGSLMFFPVLILVILSVIGGIFNVGAWLGEKYGYSEQIHHAVSPVLVHIIVFAGVAISYLVWGRGKEISERAKILWNRFYLNEAEEGIFIVSGRFLKYVSFNIFEKVVIEGFYSVVSFLTRVGGVLVSALHGGTPARVALMLILGLLIALLII
ncbi:MAG: NADH-quinone oxidoreductase subunit L [bacterium]|nr:NADH-quinone oxidoreductase subunit L [bacterium]